MYRFVRCQCHPKTPDLQGWYLILEPNDSDALMELHKGVVNFYYTKFGMDPRIGPRSVEAYIKSPARLAATWLQSIENFLAAGIILAVNSHGGMMLLDSVKVLATIESEKMIWPGYYDNEIITISHWPEGEHFYLSSNKDRVFVPPKYTEYIDAREIAEKYTNNIRFRRAPLSTFQ